MHKRVLPRRRLLATRLRESRQEQQLTQEQLARDLPESRVER